MTTPVLQANDLHYTYPCGKTALTGLNLQIAGGRKLAVIGANGSGKTTLFLCLNGTLKPTKGDLLLHGQAVSYSRKGLLEWRRQVGLVFQDPDDQIIGGTVIQDVAFGPLNLGLPEETARRAVAQTMADVGIASFASRPAHELSHGERKIVAMAGILVMRPAVVILDEPTASLDPTSTERVISLLNRIHEAGTTIVTSTHDMDFAYEWADDALVLDQGTAACFGPVEDVFAKESTIRAAKLCPPLLLETVQQLQASGKLKSTGAPIRSRQQLLTALARTNPH